LRFRGKSAGVLLLVLYGNKELPKGWSRMDLNLLPDKNVEIASSSKNAQFLFTEPGHFAIIT
jgi:hypothetical protein